MSEATMGEAYPCPFCGSEKVEMRSMGVGSGAWVACSDCDAEGPVADDDVLARAAWMKRAALRAREPAPLDRERELEAEGVFVRVADDGDVYIYQRNEDSPLDSIMLLPDQVPILIGALRRALAGEAAPMPEREARDG